MGLVFLAVMIQISLDDLAGEYIRRHAWANITCCSVFVAKSLQLASERTVLNRETTT